MITSQGDVLNVWRQRQATQMFITANTPLQAHTVGLTRQTLLRRPGTMLWKPSLASEEEKEKVVMRTKPQTAQQSMLLNNDIS